MSPSFSNMSTTNIEASTIDESSTHQNMLLSDCLMDLKKLRCQLYSAAEYFELSYTNDDEKQMVVDTLKDYTVEALVNTIDHLGSVSSKVNGFVDDRVVEVSSSELRVSCIEQRIRTCQEFIDKEGLSQQSLVITTPKYHKRYIIPVGEFMPESGTHAVAKCEESNSPVMEFESQKFQSAVRSTIMDKSPSVRKARSPSPTPRARSSSPRKLRSVSPAPQQRLHIATDKRLRSSSPLPTSNPLARSGSMTSRAAFLNSSSARRRFSTEDQKASSMRLHAERNGEKETGQFQSKGKSFLKSLLSRRRTKKDDMLYSYLDEY